MTVIRTAAKGLPFALVAALASTLHPGSPAAASAPSSPSPLGALPARSTPPQTVAPAPTVTAATAPTSYTVASGDTVSGIAARFGLDVKTVLAANGLGWSSVIFPGQKLVLAPATSAPTPAPGPATPAASDRAYDVTSGDTLIGIAKKHGVSLSAILSANGLTRGSIIYPGQTIVIPGAAASDPAPAPAPEPAPAPATAPDAATTPMTAEMRGNASTIVAVGRSIGVSDAALVVALAAAMQESSLRNIDHGDRDSLGLFQQRPSQGWGTREQITDPTYAATAFFVGVQGKTLGLLDISGWESMSVTEAAQAVQISAYPDAYGKWEASARAWLAEL